MPHTQPCQLTTKDYTILEVMLDRRRGRDETMAAILRRKLSNAIVMFRHDIPPSVVTLGSRVVYRVNDGPAETRIIAHDEMRGLVGTTLPVTNPRGLALLGLGEGQSITIARSNGRETLTVQQVAFQPEAARREASKRDLAVETPLPRGPVLRVVHRSDSPAQQALREAATIIDTGFDDPGPSAA